MKTFPLFAIVAMSFVVLGLLMREFVETTQAEDPVVIANISSADSKDGTPVTLAEAKGRARILHETLHGTLQVMHRDFFRKDQELNIPSRSLEDVFTEVKRSFDIELRWLAVDTGAMSVDNEARNELEKEVVQALRTGAKEFEKMEENRYHYAGRIRLSAVCLTCHASRRKNNDDRFAALLITQTLQKTEQEYSR